jgi:hypothetical protein
MPRFLPTFTAALLVLSAAPARGEPAASTGASGRIDSDDGRVEILGRRLRAGDTIELPEGYLRIEEDGREDREVGSFTVVAAARPDAQRDAGGAGAAVSARAPAGASPAGEGDAPAPASPAPPRAAQECRAERSAYLAELWRLSGIEVSAPADLLEGLEGPDAGPRAGFYWFALQTDPFRPLAWSSELRSRAEALSRCVRGG